MFLNQTRRCNFKVIKMNSVKPPGRAWWSLLEESSGKDEELGRSTLDEAWCTGASNAFENLVWNAPGTYRERAFFFGE